MNTFLIPLLLFIIVALILFVLFFFKKFFYKKTAYGYPSTLKRIFSFGLDFIFIHMITMSVGVFYLWQSGHMSEWVNDYIRMVKEQGKGRYYYDLRYAEMMTFYLYIIYSAISELIFGNTMGKYAMDLKLDKSKSTWWLILIRNILKIPSYFLFPIAVLGAKMNKKGLWIHDHICRTSVINKE